LEGGDVSRDVSIVLLTLRKVKAVVADVLGMDPTQEILDVRRTKSTVLWYHARDLRGENLWFRGKEGNNFPGGLLRFAGKKVTLTAYLDASGRELKPKSSRTGEQSPFEQWKDKNYRKVKVKLEGGDVSRDVSIVLLTLRKVKAVVADVLGMDPTQEILDFLGTEKDV